MEDLTEIPDPLFREAVAAIGRLLDHGARLTLPAAVGVRRSADVARLAPVADAEERQVALACAALCGDPEALSRLIDAGVDVNAYCPVGYHANTTPLHQAVSSGSLDAVKALVAAGASLDAKDLIWQATPLGWAEYLQQPEIADYLRKIDDRI